MSVWVILNWTSDLKEIEVVRGGTDLEYNPQLFMSKDEANKWAKENLNHQFKAVEI